jgi:hypothetical protein
MAGVLKQAGALKVKELDAGEIAGTDGMREALGDRGLEHTPLWVYVLREAELHACDFEDDGNRLAGVGARIVAEMIRRAIEGAGVSLIRDHPGWQPALGADDKPYSVAHLLLYAAGGHAEELAPPD